MEMGFPAQTETKGSWAITDQEGRTVKKNGIAPRNLIS